MAEPRETNHATLTAPPPPGESVADLFRQLGQPDRGLQWLAEELLAAASRRNVVVFEAVPEENYERVLYYLGNPPVRLDGFRVGVFRSLLALFVGLGRRETGADLNPYGDDFILTRESPSGPILFAVETKNTPAMQRLQITRDMPERNGTEVPATG